MFLLAASTFIALLLILFTESLARQNKLGVEKSRKAAHIVIALTIATWPFFVGMKTIAALGIAFAIATWLVKKLNLFKHTRYVERISWGEYFFGFGVSVSAFINPSDWIFVAAMLHIGVADSLGALVGEKKGKHVYKVFGNKKTLEGSVVFLVASVLIVALTVFVVPTGLGDVWPVIFWLPVIATFAEAVTPYGLDNAIVPILITALLKLLQS